MMKFLLLEDDPVLSETLGDILSREGYDIDFAYSIEEAEDLTFANSYDLYLFDINLPSGSGLTFLKDLRHAEDETPAIFITALEDLQSMEKGFALNAIDYIKKPFEPEELLIRLKAKFRNETICYGKVEYDPVSQIIRKEGQIIHLGQVPCQVFVKLLTHRGSVVKQEILLECLEQPSPNALRVAIAKLKQKLGIDIVNMRGQGYLLETL